MTRYPGAILLLSLLWLAACPRPVSELAESTPQAARAVSREASAAEANAASPAAENSGGALAGTAAKDLPPAEAVGPSRPETTSADTDDTEAAGPQPPAGAGEPVGPSAAPAEQVGPTAAGVDETASQYGALDAENFTGDAPPDTAWGQPRPRLSEDALSFAGRWRVSAVVHRQGSAQLLGDDEQWVISLERDGKFYALQERGGQQWRQSGQWRLSGVKLELDSGPGGQRAFEISQELSNICVWRDAGRETALFCVRLQDGAPPAVAAAYDSDFGQLSLRPSGPGHWRASYGEPQGTLLLAQLGGFLVGSWEQTPSRGFVLLELRSGGFSGAWCYAASTGFDGRWLGVAAQ